MLNHKISRKVCDNCHAVEEHDDGMIGATPFTNWIDVWSKSPWCNNQWLTFCCWECLAAAKSKIVAENLLEKKAAIETIRSEGLSELLKAASAQEKTAEKELWNYQKDR